MLTKIDVTELMQESYGDYAIATLNRALPDAIDGQKAVQRRILQIGLNQNFHQLVKTIRWAGDVLGRLHPHADKAITDAMYNMVDKSVSPYNWLEGHGNFGGFGFATRQRLGNYGGAAPRYTEVRLADCTKQVFDLVQAYKPNFDASYQEVVQYIPAIPVLALNGAIGIGTGFACTAIGYEVSDVANILDMHIMRGMPLDKAVQEVEPMPAFTSGCIVAKNDGYYSYLNSGHGTMLLRGRWRCEDGAIYITHLPLTDAETYIVKLAEAMQAGLVTGIADVEDFTSQEICIKISLRKKANHQQVLEQLLANTPLQDIFKGNCTALVNGMPKTIGLANLLGVWLEARKAAVLVKLRTDRYDAEAQLHNLQGLMRGVEKLDEVIGIVRKQRNRQDAVQSLMAELAIDEQQAKAILGINLGQLVATELADLELKAKQIQEAIANATELIDDPQKLCKYILHNLQAISQQLQYQLGMEFAEVDKVSKLRQVEPRMGSDLELILEHGASLARPLRQKRILAWMQARDRSIPLDQAWMSFVRDHLRWWEVEYDEHNPLDRRSKLPNAEELRQQFNAWAKSEGLPAIRKYDVWLNALWTWWDNVELVKLDHIKNHRS